MARSAAVPFELQVDEVEAFEDMFGGDLPAIHP